MADYAEGQTATNPKTHQTVVYKGGQWVNAPSTPGAPIPHKLSVQEQKALDLLNAQGEGAQQTIAQYNGMSDVFKRLPTGPVAGTLLGMSLPDQGGFADKLGTLTAGALGRATGAISDQNATDYQRLTRLRNQRVLLLQILQKGPQTEGDAVRMGSTEPNATNLPSVNQQAMDSDLAIANRALKRGPFYTQWANRYGLFAPNEQGQSVEQAFQNSLGQQVHGGAKATGPTIRRIQ